MADLSSMIHRKTVEEIRPHSMNIEYMYLIKNGTCQNASETNVGLLPHEELPTANLEYGTSHSHHMLFMSEVSPVVTFARTKIILARANIHGVRSNFLHGLLVELRTRTVGCVPDPFLPA